MKAKHLDQRCTIFFTATSSGYCCLLTTFVNSLDPDQLFDILTVFPERISEKVNFEKDKKFWKITKHAKNGHPGTPII